MLDNKRVIYNGSVMYTNFKYIQNRTQWVDLYRTKTIA